uniref:Amino acid transporter transmembrane domain-containing protein n=1 Tax=Octactis speculum TaxID=3111310 RepID=A0A7S2DDR2_9STRA|mmetsp:Transcript_47179/g.64240  ORF Transcript_47179/g.64240 Transcript_47179/m.64240 type:complete len:210 (+) Transcript_47179:32-661(+)
MNVLTTQHNELYNPTKRRASTVASSAVCISTVVYLIMSLAGYKAFGDAVDGDVLNSFPPGNPVVNVARVALSLVVIFSYPVVFHPARDSFLSLAPAAGLLSEERSKALIDGTAYGSILDMNMRTAIVVSYLTLSTLVALFCLDLDAVLGLAGATGATMICFIIPGACYVYAFPHAHLMRKLAWCQLVLGSVLGPVAVVAIILVAAGVVA